MNSDYWEGTAMKKSLVFLFIVFHFALIVTDASAGTGITQPIKLKAITFVPQNVAGGGWGYEFINRVNKESNGLIQIEYLGGSEVISQPDQYKATMDGVVDLCVSPMTWYSQEMPEALVAGASEKSPSEERKPGGLYDLFVNAHKRINLFYLGRVNGNVISHIGLNVTIQKPEDLKGLKIRTSTAYNAFFKAMGIAGVSTKPSEIYTSMERGVVEGYVIDWESVTSYKLNEVTKYWLDIPLYPAGTQVLIMNLSKWNSIPKSLQQLMMDIMAKEIEPEMMKAFAKAYEDAISSCKNSGMTSIKFTQDDEARFLSLAKDSKWKDIQRVLPPESFKRFKAAAID